ncbi:hypothetical protein SBDP1_110004 [Syntrophobacter sp. SbD1]|nr:hypothetical protein SBDP1_110004 [Syntrophobacter sp. SbD1]
MICVNPLWLFLCASVVTGCSPAGKFDLPTAVAKLFEQYVAVVALDLYHTVFYCASGPALCLELFSKLFELRLRAGNAGNYRNAFAFAPFGFSSNPHHGGAPGDRFLTAYTFFCRSAALGTHPPVGGRVDNAAIRLFHFLHRLPKAVEIAIEVNPITIIADLVLKILYAT